jgi:hypothetical protein
MHLQPLSDMTERSFFLLRMVIWLVLLLAAWSILQYSVHAWDVVRMQRVQPVSSGALAGLLGWDALYMLLAGLIVAASAGCLMWRPWARRALRVLAFLLAAYSLMGAVALVARWQGTDPAGTALVAQAVDPALARVMAEKTRRILLLVAAMKFLAVPLLAWLGWRLGQPGTVRRFAR